MIRILLAEDQNLVLGAMAALLRLEPDFEVVGDRFVFPSDVLFDTGSSALRPEATFQLDKLAAALRELEGQIPADIGWVMRIDGHTDIRPIATIEFPSNWELSSARAISVA